MTDINRLSTNPSALLGADLASVPSPSSKDRLQHPKTHTILLVSHAHTPPLTQLPSSQIIKPDLSFSARQLPNPPKHVRDAYDGRSKRLQEWLLDGGSTEGGAKGRGGEVRRWLTGVEREVEAAMRSVVHGELGLKEKCVDVDAGGEREPGCMVEHASESEKANHLGEERCESAETEDNASGSTDESNNSTEDDDISRNPRNQISRTTATDDEIQPDLIVSVFCERGKHRSVALVDILAKHQWLEGWTVQVWHRDVGKKNVERNGGGGKGGERGKRRGGGKRSGGFIGDD